MSSFFYPGDVIKTNFKWEGPTLELELRVSSIFMINWTPPQWISGFLFSYGEHLKSLIGKDQVWHLTEISRVLNNLLLISGTLPREINKEKRTSAVSVINRVSQWSVCIRNSSVNSKKEQNICCNLPSHCYLRIISKWPICLRRLLLVSADETIQMMHMMTHRGKALRCAAL